MSAVNWIEPPTRRTKRQWGEIVEELKTRPGEWADVGTGSRSLQWKLSTGQVPAVDPDEFDIITRSLDDMPRRIWMRYRGPSTTGSVVDTELATKLSIASALLKDIAEQLAKGVAG